MDVAVVGAGTAGASAAIFLARAGHAVRLFEAVADPGAVGAGIMLQPTGMSVLARLGLLGPVIERGSKVGQLRCITRRGRSVLDLSYRDLHQSAFGLGLHRGVLFEALWNEVGRTSSIEVCTNTSIDRMEARGTQRALFDGQGSNRGSFDLVVIADGARSKLRHQTSLVRRAREYPWGALWFIGEDPARTFDGVLFQVVEGTQRMLGLLPSGLGPSGETPRVSAFWSVRADRARTLIEDGLHAWKTLLMELEPRARIVLEQIDTPEEVLFARYWDVELQPWHEPGVVILGDAAHATSPQLGQGANLALMDAAELADALSSVTNQRTLDEGLERYSRTRRAHLGYYQWATRFLTPFFQSDAPWLGWMRDAFMGIACRVPYVRGRMISTMCGLERGILFGQALPLPRLPAHV